MKQKLVFTSDIGVSEVLVYFILSRLLLPLAFLMTYFESLEVYRTLVVAIFIGYLVSYTLFVKDKEGEDKKAILIVNCETAIWIMVIIFCFGGGISKNMMITIYSLCGTAMFSALLYFIVDKIDFDSSEQSKKILFIISSLLVNLAAVLALYLMISEGTNVVYTKFHSNTYSFDPYIDPNFEIVQFMGYYGIMALISILESVLFVLIVKKFGNNEPKPTKKKHDIFSTVMSDFDPKNWLYLFILLSFASLWEEIIFRFIAMNILDVLGVPLWGVILISSMIFGYAHKTGGILHIISSFNAGIIFALVYISHGIFYVWVLHLFWNLLVMVQLWLTNQLSN